MRARALAFVLLTAAACGARAQSAETIVLRHRSAEQVLPVVAPLLEPGGALTGTGPDVYLRASAPNRKQIRTLIAALDHPPRPLTVTIRHEPPPQARADTPADPPGTVIADSRTGTTRIGPAQSNEKTWGTEGAGDAPLQVAEGEVFEVPTERAVAIEFRTRSGGNGAAGVRGMTTYLQPALLSVRAQLAGSWVALEVQPLDAPPGLRARGAPVAAAPVAAASTLIRARTGSWIAVGRRASADQRGLWLKVDEAVDEAGGGASGTPR